MLQAKETDVSENQLRLRNAYQTDSLVEQDCGKSALQIPE